jgi:hypothetical protein
MMIAFDMGRFPKGVKCAHCNKKIKQDLVRTVPNFWTNEVLPLHRKCSDFPSWEVEGESKPWMPRMELAVKDDNAFVEHVFCEPGEVIDGDNYVFVKDDIKVPEKISLFRKIFGAHHELCRIRICP